jgi:hypothetical protein
MDCRTALLTVLDQVDYTSGACGLTEAVGAALPKEVIALARKAIAEEAAQPPAQEYLRRKRYLHDSKFRDLVSYLRKGIYEEICTLRDIRDAVEIIASLPEEPS